jgi:hypothetical protein
MRLTQDVPIAPVAKHVIPILVVLLVLLQLDIDLIWRVGA